jgi:hypothetical protein
VHRSRFRGLGGRAAARRGRASRPAAIAHAAGLWRAERWLHVDIEPSLNHLAAARPVLAETADYYYGLAHFIITPLVLAWLWLRRPAAFGPLRSALVLATTGANVVFWTWPVAPPRFARRWAWAVTGAAEAVCVAGLVIAQCQLLAPAAAAAWQTGQYRRRDSASSTAGVWAVLAGAVASTIAALAVLAVGQVLLQVHAATLEHDGPPAGHGRPTPSQPTGPGATQPVTTTVHDQPAHGSRHARISVPG